MNATNPNSIRQNIIGMILAGKPTKEIAEMLTAKFPESAAAKKSAKHIGWYRARLKKDGKLPTPATVETVKATPKSK
jgi:hypothetical protein